MFVHNCVAMDESLQLSVDIDSHTNSLLDCSNATLVVGDQYNIYVTFADSPDVVWGQLAEKTSEIESLIVNLQIKMESSTRVPLTRDPVEAPPPLNEPCCVQYALDQSWCRGLLQSVDVPSSTADVLFVDFGNTETIPLSEMFVLPKEFLSISAQATSFSLHGIVNKGEVWSVEALLRFKELYEDKELVCDVVCLDSNGYPAVKLMDPESNYDIAQVMIAEGHGLSANETESHEEKTVTNFAATVTPSSSFKTIPIAIGSKLEASVTSIETLNSFHIQLFSQAEQLAVITGQVELHCSSPNLQPVGVAKAGMPVLAQFTEDQQWYRAYTTPPTDGTSNKWGVVFVDWGNTQLINLSDLKHIPNSLMTTPTQAVQCSLDVSVDLLDNKKLLDSFNELLDKPLICVALDRRAGVNGLSQYSVELYKDGKNVLELMSVNITSCNPWIKGCNPWIKGRGLPPVIPADDRGTVISTSLNSHTHIDKSNDNINTASRDHTHTDDHALSIDPMLATPLIGPVKLAILSQVEVFVTHVLSPSEFYVFLASHSSNIQSLSDQMYEYYVTNKVGVRSHTPCVGSYYSAPFTDGNYYRCRVLSIHLDSVEVFFIDFGNTGLVDVSDMFILHFRFAIMPAQAVKCYLTGVAMAMDVAAYSDWSVHCVKTIQDIAMDKRAKLKVIGMKKGVSNSAAHYEVKLTIESQDVSELLISKGLINSNGPIDVFKRNPLVDNKPHPLAKPRATPKSISFPSLSIDECYDVTITEIVAENGRFYCQLRRNKEQLLSIGKIIKKQSLKHLKRNAIKKGNFVLGRRNADGQWRRAIVRSCTRFFDSVRVQNIDYGNIDEVPFKQFCELPLELYDIPIQGVHCQFDGSAGWMFSPEAKSIVEKKLLNAKCRITVLRKESGRTFVVDIVTRDDGNDVKDWILQSGLLFKSTTRHTNKDIKPVAVDRSPTNTKARVQSSLSCISPGQTTFSGYLVHVESIEKFYCQPVETANEMEALSLSMQSNYNKSPSPPPVMILGSFVAALSGKKPKWYRARIVEVGGSDVRVFFVDYGHTSIIPNTRIRRLESQFTSLPCQAVPCQLSSVMCVIGDGDNHILSDIVGRSTVRMGLDKVIEGGLSVVEMTTEKGLDVCRELKRMGLIKTTMKPLSINKEASNKNYNLSVLYGMTCKSSPLPFQVKEGDILCVYVSHCQDDIVWVQPASQIPELQSLSQSIADTYVSSYISSNILTKFRPGDVCCAQYTEDNDWYRARVLGEKEGKVKVFFVDYGNTCLVDKVCSLVDHFIDQPQLAIPCVFEATPTLPRPDSINDIAIQFVDRPWGDGRWRVELISDDDDVTDSESPDWSVDITPYCAASPVESNSTDEQIVSSDSQNNDNIDASPVHSSMEDSSSDEDQISGPSTNKEHHSSSSSSSYSIDSSSDSSISLPSIDLSPLPPPSPPSPPPPPPPPVFTSDCINSELVRPLPVSNDGNHGDGQCATPTTNPVTPIDTTTAIHSDTEGPSVCSQIPIVPPSSVVDGNHDDTPVAPPTFHSKPKASLQGTMSKDLLTLLKQCDLRIPDDVRTVTTYVNNVVIIGKARGMNE